MQRRFFHATMNGTEVIAVYQHNGTEDWTEWSAEPTRLPATPEEEQDYLEAYGWQIVNSTDDFKEIDA